MSRLSGAFLAIGLSLLLVGGAAGGEVAPPPASARPAPGMGAIKGVVIDDSGLAIPGVLVELSSPAMAEGTRQHTTDAEGAWHFTDLPPGIYTVTASRAGFTTVRKAGVEVWSDRVGVLPLELRASGTEELIEVVSTRTAVTKEFLARIPTGRSYQGAVGHAAGVVGGGNANTARGDYDENTWDPPPPLSPGWAQPSTNQDQYAAIVENPFQVVADSPLSTFGIDVDTASYSNVRRYLEAGEAPPRDAVRIEELINYFPTDDAPPEGDAAFVARAEVTEAPWAAGHRLVRIGVQGRVLPEAAVPPRNLVFLVDVSGSMDSPDKLPLVKEGLTLLARQLGPADRVAIVTYAGEAGVALPPTSGARSAEVIEAIERLGAGGSTAGAAGIRTAYELARRNFRAGAVNRVVLATDGDFNVGVSNESDLLQLIEAERDSGVFLTVLGFGRGNLQDAKMELLADHGNGYYAYIDGRQELEKVLREQVGATLVTIAKDVKIQVEFNPAQVASYRLLGYENRVLAAEDFADDRKDAGEIGAGHSVTALYEVVPVGVPAPRKVAPLRYQSDRVATSAAASGELLTVHLRYKEPTGDTSRLSSFVVRDAGGDFASASDDTRWAASVAGFGMLLRDSPHRGGLDWEWVRRNAREALGDDAHGYRAEFLALVERARRLDRVAAE